MNWLSGIAFTLFGEPVKWADMTGNLIGLVALGFGWRRSVWSWPLQLLSGAVLITAYWSGHVPGLIGKQLIVVVAAVWGWTRWRRGRQETGDITVRFASWTERAALVGATALGTAAVTWAFLHITETVYHPWAMAYIFAGTLAAMYAQARGWVEFWLAWIAVDVVGVPLAFNSGFAFTGLTFSIYFVLVLLGLRAWWLRTRDTRPATDTVLQGASA
ncbi:nicotinamide mononucleotide transporter family protein [Kitasatospora sp. NBC_00240]|uniref:nicotinamide mononucleotide transporter family protein n=1 Tax=Kitasatospora sp. NBC_00240 TaxID=2903567 RepID=UPI00225729AD|nr:nicotinamide mononucleotide transporter family protein [Kitasatospora sp. NBC_00240]MCX5208997.1 nicotinamide mononucleotide transporter family protein [Kitasatospora sp. NBC_00240]